jgi:hypothetical protein
MLQLVLPVPENLLMLNKFVTGAGGAAARRGSCRFKKNANCYAYIIAC